MIVNIKEKTIKRVIVAVVVFCPSKKLSSIFKVSFSSGWGAKPKPHKQHHLQAGVLLWLFLLNLIPRFQEDNWDQQQQEVAQKLQPTGR